MIIYLNARIRSTCKSVLQSGVNETELVGSTRLQFGDVYFFFLDGDWPANTGVTKEKEVKGMGTWKNKSPCCVFE